MAKQNEETQSKQDAPKSSISIEELQAVVNAAVSAALQQTNASGKDIAQALLDARKPYIDPKQKANEESMRRSMREQAKLAKENAKREQAACPHVKGCSESSSRSDPFDSALAHLILDTGERVAVCTNCTRIFSSLNPEDVPFLQKKSTNQVAMSGRREFANPLAAQRARLGLDQVEIFAEEEKPVEVAAK